MYRFEPVSSHIQAIHSPTREIQYLIAGNDKSLLVDTGSGYGSILTEAAHHGSQPSEVLLTHAHPDHAFGIAGHQPVYLHQKDWDLYDQEVQNVCQKAYLESVLNRQIDDQDFIPAPKHPHFHPVQEGDCFDLGGVHAEIFELPGHTQGSIVVLIPEDGVLITGDAANTMTWMFLPESSTVKEYQNALISILNFARVLTLTSPIL